MLKANIVATSVSHNQLFDLQSPLNRDNSLLPFVKLRQAFLRHGIELNTPDLNVGKDVVFEIHLDARSPSANDCPLYAVLFETRFIHADNDNRRLLSNYLKVFTWDDHRIDQKRWIKINFPNVLSICPADGFDLRPQLAVMIAGNKSLRHKDPRDLYLQRQIAIHWFETHAPDDLALYGTGWHLPFMKPGFIGKVTARLQRFFSKTSVAASRPSYRGKIKSKRDVLKAAKFSICYENVLGLDGYITEKLFDCFCAGCVPVYWGAPNIGQHIPADCFIDRRKFRDWATLHQHLKFMPEARYLQHQQAIANFLSSAAAAPFGVDAFVNTLCTHILDDLHVST